MFNMVGELGARYSEEGRKEGRREGGREGR